MKKALFTDNSNNNVIYDEDIKQNQEINFDDSSSVDINKDDIIEGFKDLVPALGYNKFDGHTYVSGATESGKSFFINKMLMNDRRKRDVFLFTDLPKRDKSFMPMFESGRLKIVRRKASEPWEADYIEFQSKLHGSILVFDDISDPDVLQMRDHALLKGRHKDVVVIAVNHKMRNWMDTVQLLTDCKYIVGFPNSNRGTIQRYIKDEFGVNHKTSKIVMQKAIQDGRQIIFHRFSPNVVATQKSVIRL